MGKKNFTNLLRNLNKLRGIIKRRKPYTRKRKENESSLRDINVILLRHKLFLKLKPLSPISNTKTNILSPMIRNSPHPNPSLENYSSVFDILREFKNFTNVRPISPIPSSPILENSLIFHSPVNSPPLTPMSSIFSSRDPRISSNTSTYNYSKLISPIQDNSKLPKISNFELIPQTRSNSEKPRILSDITMPIITCHAHFSTDTREFCFDCFIANYFGEGFYCNPKLLITSEKFKNSFFPSFEKPEFEWLIEGTEIPFF